MIGSGVQRLARALAIAARRSPRGLLEVTL
jgi:hypothetical protein